MSKVPHYSVQQLGAGSARELHGPPGRTPLTG